MEGESGVSVILNMEAMVSDLLSAAYERPINAVLSSINPVEIPDGIGFRWCENGFDLQMRFEPAQILVTRSKIAILKLQYDIYSRFLALKNLKGTSAEIQVLEDRSAPGQGYELLLFGFEEGRSPSLWVILNNSPKLNHAVHSSSFNSLKQIKSSLRIMRSLDELNSGELSLELLSSWGESFTGTIRKTNGQFRTIIVEKNMNDDVEQKLKSAKAKIYLGTIEISAWEALNLRPGQKIEFEVPESFDATLEVGGAKWAKVALNLSGDNGQIEVEEIFTQR